MPLPDAIAAMELRRLVRDTQADLVVLDRLAREAADVARRPAGLGAEAQALLAVKLHGYYTALESILGRVARTLEGSLPSGPTHRRDLLRGMTLDLPEVRPAVLGADRLADLVDLLAFRHFFRHAYAVELDEAQLRAHAARLARVHPLVTADLAAFLTVAGGWIADLERS